MTNRTLRQGSLGLFLATLVAVPACGGNSTDDNGGKGGGAPPGASCERHTDCKSSLCNAQGICVATVPGSGFGGSPGSSGGGGSGNTTAGGTQPPGFTGTPGSTGFKGLTPGCGPETAGQCTNKCELGGATSSTVIRPPATLCFSGTADPTPADPTAMIEQVIEEVNGRRMIHLRVTFDPSFVDNTYGANAIGWDHGQGQTGSGGSGTAGMPGMPDKGMPGGMKAGKSGHTFKDLVGSDHVELLLTDSTGATVMDFKLDYISEATATSCGYGNLGVTGGEGKMITGNASSIIGATSSLHRNLNGCGYCLTTDSPATDARYTPNASAPDWDYRVVYEVWVDLGAFGSAGFGQAYINSVHASPSKLDSNTVDVVPTPCPPSWDTPFCPPGSTNPACVPTTGTCPPNYQIYIATEGKSICTPIPFSGYPGRAACPEGYVLDAATEGKYCVPAPK